MSKTLTISDDLFTKLSKVARQRGLPDVEKLLESWQADEDERARRIEAVKGIDALRTRLLATYGEMPDSVALIREDRDR
jgi:hypothetical protein